MKVSNVAIHSRHVAEIMSRHLGDSKGKEDELITNILAQVSEGQWQNAVPYAAQLFNVSLTRPHEVFDLIAESLCKQATEAAKKGQERFSKPFLALPGIKLRSEGQPFSKEFTLASVKKWLLQTAREDADLLFLLTGKTELPEEPRQCERPQTFQRERPFSENIQSPRFCPLIPRWADVVS